MRLFLAIDLPENIVHILKETQRTLPGKLNKNFHITLKFLGDVEESKIPDLIKNLEFISQDPFTLKLHNLGAFPNLQSPRVIWVGLSPKEPLINLHKQIARALNFVPKLRPHITLSRLGFGKRPSPIQALSISSPAFQIEKFHLYSSDLTFKSAVHKILHTFSFS